MKPAASRSSTDGRPTFEAERRGVALAFRLVLGTRVRSWREEQKKGEGGARWLRRELFITVEKNDNDTD